jgi:hypothetical protein
MPKFEDLSFLLVLRCPNWLYVYCTICSQMAHGAGCLLKHIHAYKRHVNNTQADKAHVHELLKARPDLQRIVNA